MFALLSLEAVLGIGGVALLTLCLVTFLLARRRSMTRRASRRAVRRVDKILRSAEDDDKEERNRLGRMTRFHVMHDALAMRRTHRLLSRDQRKRSKLVRSIAECQADATRANQELRLIGDAREKLHESEPLTLSPTVARWFNVALIGGDLAIVSGALQAEKGSTLTPELAFLSASATALSLWFAGKLAGGLVAARLERAREVAGEDAVRADIAPFAGIDRGRRSSQANVELVVALCALVFIACAAVALGLLRQHKVVPWMVLSAVPALGSMALAMLTKSDAHHRLNTAFRHYRSARWHLTRSLKRVARDLGKARSARAVAGAFIAAKLTMLERAVAAEAGQLDPSAKQTADIIDVDVLLTEIGVLRKRLHGRITPDQKVQDFEDIEVALSQLWQGLWRTALAASTIPPVTVNGDPPHPKPEPSMV